MVDVTLVIDCRASLGQESSKVEQLKHRAREIAGRQENVRLTIIDAEVWPRKEGEFADYAIVSGGDEGELIVVGNSLLKWVNTTITRPRDGMHITKTRKGFFSGGDFPKNS